MRAYRTLTGWGDGAANREPWRAIALPRARAARRSSTEEAGADGAGRGFRRRRDMAATRLVQASVSRIKGSRG